MSELFDEYGLEEEPLPPEPSFTPKKTKTATKSKGGWMGRILALFLGAVIGVGACVGGVYYAADKVPVQTLIGLFPMIDYETQVKDKILGADHGGKTIVELVSAIKDAVTNEEKKTLSDLDAIFPILGDKAEDLSGTVKENVGITLNTTELFSKTFGELPAYLTDTVTGTPLADILKAQDSDGKLDPMLMEICYGEENVDYTYDETDKNKENPKLREGLTPVTIASLIDNPISSVERVSVASVAKPDISDTVMLAICYGQQDVTYKIVRDTYKDANGVTVKYKDYIDSNGNYLWSPQYLPENKGDTYMDRHGITVEYGDYINEFGDYLYSQYLPENKNETYTYTYTEYTETGESEATITVKYGDYIHKNGGAYLFSQYLPEDRKEYTDNNGVTVKYGAFIDGNGDFFTFAQYLPANRSETYIDKNGVTVKYGDYIDKDGKYLFSQYLPKEKVEMQQLFLLKDEDNHFIDHNDLPLVGKVEEVKDNKNFLKVTQYRTNADHEAITDNEGNPKVKYVYYIKSTPNDEGKYLAYQTPEDGAKEALFLATKIMDMQDDSMDIIGAVTLADALEVYPHPTDPEKDPHALMFSLAYGLEGEDYEIWFNPETNQREVKMLHGSMPNTIADLKNRNTELINDVLLADIMGEDRKSAVMMYMLYGKEGIHYTIDPDTDEIKMLPKRIAILKDEGKIKPEDKGKFFVYNEYGELLQEKEGENKGYQLNTNSKTYVDAAGRVFTYVIPDPALVPPTITTERGEATIYYLLNEYDELEKFHKSTMADLAGSDNLVSRLTKRLTVAEVFGEELEEDALLKHLADSTIDSLSDDIGNLTFVQVFEDSIKEKEIYYDHEQYLPEGKNPIYTDNNGVIVKCGDYIDKEGNYVYSQYLPVDKDETYVDNNSVTVKYGDYIDKSGNYLCSQYLPENKNETYIDNGGFTVQYGDYIDKDGNYIYSQYLPENRNITYETTDGVIAKYGAFISRDGRFLCAQYLPENKNATYTDANEVTVKYGDYIDKDDNYFCSQYLTYIDDNGVTVRYGDYINEDGNYVYSQYLPENKDATYTDSNGVNVKYGDYVDRDGNFLYYKEHYQYLGETYTYTDTDADGNEVTVTVKYGDYIDRNGKYLFSQYLPEDKAPTYTDKNGVTVQSGDYIDKDGKYLYSQYLPENKSATYTDYNGVIVKYGDYIDKNGTALYSQYLPEGKAPTYTDKNGVTVQIGDYIDRNGNYLYSFQYLETETYTDNNGVTVKYGAYIDRNKNYLFSKYFGEESYIDDNGVTVQYGDYIDKDGNSLYRYSPYQGKRYTDENGVTVKRGDCIDKDGNYLCSRYLPEDKKETYIDGNGVLVQYGDYVDRYDNALHSRYLMYIDGNGVTVQYGDYIDSNRNYLCSQEVPEGDVIAKCVNYVEHSQYLAYTDNNGIVVKYGDYIDRNGNYLYSEREGEYLDANGKVITFDQRITGEWKYILKDKDGNINTTYTVSDDMDKLLENMTRNVQNAPLKELKEDGIMDFDDEMLKTPIKENAALGITAPEGAEKAEFLGDLTTLQMLDYLTAVLNAIPD